MKGVITSNSEHASESHQAIARSEKNTRRACLWLLVAAGLIIVIRLAPYQRLRPHVSNPSVLEATRRALARAGYDWDELVNRLRER